MHFIIIIIIIIVIIIIVIVIIVVRKLVYHFNGWNSSVLTLVQSPALDVIGVGLANGTIIMHNIKCDNELMSFTQDLGPVTGIAFRTGNLSEEGLMTIGI